MGVDDNSDERRPSKNKEKPEDDQIYSGSAQEEKKLDLEFMRNQAEINDFGKNNKLKLPRVSLSEHFNLGQLESLDKEIEPDPV
jgi:hypothetical protein